jgi:hypothetical protein
MSKNTQRFTILLALLGLACVSPALAKKGDKSEASAAEITANSHPVLWSNPTDITSRNLFYGPGGKDHQP